MMAPHKRSAEEAESLLLGVRCIFVGIGGVTTPISFAENTFNPYVRNNVESYLTKNFENPDVQKSITALREQAAKDKEEKVEGVVEIPSGDAKKDDIVKAVADNVRWQMDGNRNTAELKTLQGLILKYAFESEEMNGYLFQDVGPMLKVLSEEGYKLYVYSTENVESQKLLFTYSNQGYLKEVFSGFFDTTIGSKIESASYKKLAAEVKNEPKDILVLTHSPEEAEAAVGAGLRSALVIRPGNAELTDEHLQKFACIERFDELYGDEDDDEDIKRFAGDNGEQDDDEEEDEEGDDDDEEGEEEEEDNA